MDQLPKRIFLSHKGIDKPRVQRYKRALEAVGLQAWLDEDMMPAGVVRERGLLAGFEQSCAAVFFVTPNFHDDEYLATEIEYAIDQERERRPRFVIITLQIIDQDGTIPEVPPLLRRRFVVKAVNNDLDGFAEIVRALPLQLPPAEWSI